ncbi:PREDICTED: protein RESTRICTED TEV MOVEMENT 2-like isoform X2 [Lupinus angustifolius]|uniref:protein RESTRICTED TEV MOVEMENT 2-like isoform X2 n=1 Tax=Lupinus angustifolius TaxID=3871 RepID=UPI00092F29CB|nr:PREDICTED: protein RESTRICTED TEV MOVEMENT 2-like isoform X2 [Lupinus angustifolius]
MFNGSSFFPTIYEDLELKYESRETPQSYLLIVHIPHGFTREHIGAKVEFNYGRIRVFGERPLGNSKRSRFNIVYQVPTTCNINGIKGKFDSEIVTITMQKKVIQLQPITQQEAPKHLVQETESNPEKNKENISGYDPKSTLQSKENVDHETSNIPKAREESMPQKGQEAGHDPKSNVQNKEHDRPNLPKGTKETMPQMGQEVVNEEKERVVKEVTKEDTKKTSQLGKQPIKDVVERVVKEVTKENSHSDVKEIKEESKESSKDEENFVDPNPANKKKRKLHFDHEADEESYEKNIPESTVKRIKKVAASASETVTNLTKRFNEEDKQKLIYMGAAVIVVALGVCASYKFRSSPRL